MRIDNFIRRVRGADTLTLLISFYSFICISLSVDCDLAEIELAINGLTPARLLYHMFNFFLSFPTPFAPFFLQDWNTVAESLARVVLKNLFHILLPY